MPGRNPDAAWKSFIDPLREALSCIVPIYYSPRLIDQRIDKIVPVVWETRDGDTKSEYHRLRGCDLRIRSRMRVRLIRDDRDGYGPLRVTTCAYSHRLMNDSGWLVRWDWHSSENSDVARPHLHMRTGVGCALNHVPTGRVSLEDVILYALREKNATPLRDGCERILRDSRDVHVMYRSWSTDGPPE